ncbi:universal stress protein [Luteibacter yeojuensis]|uniref:Universal stress protein n=1 Tax=Luteibacter yeojuensis TaxID=345309 RepID=A0A7X5QSG7_9GAMM|nr:universal stress protein [Luteibacter yeojuensis]NID14602.1 universal stress protein [Luteibacter yeojuensis]
MGESMYPQDPADALNWRQPDESEKKSDVDPMASLRDIAVVLAQLTGDMSAITLAGSLARRAGANLHLLQMLAMPVEATDAWALIPDPSLVQRYADIRTQATRQAREMEHRLSAMRVRGEVRTLEALCSAPPAMAAAAARRTDLCVLGRPGDSPSEVSMAHAYFAGLLLESGRPVLVVPEGTAARLPPRHAVVAWADSAEAARAVHDALPFLEASEAVDVVIVDAPKAALETAGRSVEGLLAHLREHGVRAELTTCSSGHGPVSRALLDQAHRKQAQLIVAGGYGHGRVREWAVGGTTRELFLESPVPVLFSH